MGRIARLPDVVAKSASPDTEASPTAAGLVYRKLRDDIVHAVLSPNAKLRVGEVVERYGFGAIPVREALTRLAAEAWVTYSQQRGFAVAPISDEDLKDLTQARVWLSESVLREAVSKASAEWEERVLLSYHRLNKVPRYLSIDPPLPNPDYDRLHREFHSALWSGCGSRWMVELCNKLFDHSERYRNVSRTVAIYPREDEHKEILDAALSRRVEDTIELSTKHIMLTADIVLGKEKGVGKRRSSKSSAKGTARR